MLPELCIWYHGCSGYCKGSIATIEGFSHCQRVGRGGSVVVVRSGGGIVEKG